MTIAPIEEVLVSIDMIEWIAKDTHYRTNGQWFYALHLLADKVDFGTSADDLKEAYYLGMRETLPPTEKEIHAKVVARCPDVSALDNAKLITLLYEMCATGLYAVEEAKREVGLVAGIHAILDSISLHLLVVKGLCWRTLNQEANDNGEEGTHND